MKNGAKNIQAAGYNGTRTVIISFSFQNLEEFRAFIDHYKSSPEYNRILGRQDLNDSIMNPTNLEELGSRHAIIRQLLNKGLFDFLVTSDHKIF